MLIKICKFLAVDSDLYVDSDRYVQNPGWRHHVKQTIREVKYFLFIRRVLMKKLFSSSMRTCMNLSLIALANLAGCGGGGGGGGESFFGAANVSVRATPSRIDSGDRTQVTMELSDVHENGIGVKIRFPAGLRYVQASSFLMVDEKEIDVSPTVNQTIETEELTYLVFYLSQAQFRRSSREYNGEPGTLIIQLEGRKAVSDGEIEVDPDVDDPDEDNQVEFDINNPEFVPEGSASIEVVAE
jgi:hypothetical protein